VDRLLHRTLEEIARDRRSGAAELALRAVTALAARLHRPPRPTQQELEEIVTALLSAQPSMAPLLRLANEVALGADHRDPALFLRKAIAAFAKTLRTAPGRISQKFARALRPRPRIVATYSYSSTVLHALRQRRNLIERVLCSESRPGDEGRSTARKLAQAGIRVLFCTDIALASRMDQTGVFVFGADAILPWGFVNKIGTGALVSAALKARRPVWLLADSTKFLPKPLASRLSMVGLGDRSGVWRKRPKGISVLNTVFEPTEFSPAIRLLTERGWMTPAKIRREMERIRISPRLAD